MSFTPYVQVVRNASGSCCWEVVLTHGLKVQVSSGQQVARIMQSIRPAQGAP